MKWPLGELNTLLREIEETRLNTPLVASSLCCMLEELADKVKKHKQSLRGLLPSQEIGLFRSNLKGYSQTATEVSLLVDLTSRTAMQVRTLSAHCECILEERTRIKVETTFKHWLTALDGAGSDVVREVIAIQERAAAEKIAEQVAAFAHAITELKFTCDLLGSLHGRTTGAHRKVVKSLQYDLAFTGPSHEWYGKLTDAHGAIKSDSKLKDVNKKLDEIVRDIELRLSSASDFCEVLRSAESMPDDLRSVIDMLRRDDEATQVRQPSSSAPPKRLDQQTQRIDEVKQTRAALNPLNDDDVQALYQLYEDVTATESESRASAERCCHLLMRCDRTFRDLLFKSKVEEVHQIDPVAEPALVSAREFKQWHEDTRHVLDKLLSMGRDYSYALAHVVEARQKTLKNDCNEIKAQIVTDKILADAHTLLGEIQNIAMPTGLADALLALRALDQIEGRVKSLQADADAEAARWAVNERDVNVLRDQLEEAIRLFAETTIVVPPRPKRVIYGIPVGPQDIELQQAEDAIQAALAKLREQIIARVTSMREWLDRAAAVLAPGTSLDAPLTVPAETANAVEWATCASEYRKLVERTAQALIEGEADLNQRLDDACARLRVLIPKAQRGDIVAAERLLDDLERLRAEGPIDQSRSAQDERYVYRVVERSERLNRLRKRIEEHVDRMTRRAQHVTDRREKLQRRLGAFFENGHGDRVPRSLSDRAIGLVNGTFSQLVEQSATEVKEQLKEAEDLMTLLEAHVSRAMGRGQSPGMTGLSPAGV